jgi:hypothetical protein
VTSKSVGGVSEIAVLAPVRNGIVPGERRTFEERLRAIIDNLAERHLQGIPTQLSQIPTIHFGRMIVIRPEQYLLYSSIDGVEYHPLATGEGLTNGGRPHSGIPKPMDDYVVEGSGSSQTDNAPELRTFLLTLVEFDGDLKVYMRDVAEFLAHDFDSIFVNCEDYPGTSDFERFWLWVRRYQINTSLFYAPYSNLSAVRIRQLAEFKRRFDVFVAKVRSPCGSRTSQLDELFDEFLRENQQHACNFPAPGGTYQIGDG